MKKHYRNRTLSMKKGLKVPIILKMSKKRLRKSNQPKNLKASKRTMNKKTMAGLQSQKSKRMLAKVLSLIWTTKKVGSPQTTINRERLNLITSLLKKKVKKNSKANSRKPSLL
jgi:hypothetical protein